MARLVVHAGMPKAGSSAVQQVLADHAAELAGHGVVTAVADDAGDAGVRFRVTTERTNNSVDVVMGLRDPARRAATLRSLEDGLGDLLAEHATVVVTSEALAQPFWQQDAEFLGLLDRLAAAHTVRVAYYVRPQHTALEAAWRQWGYRSGQPPGQYMRDRSRMMHYLQTHEAVAAAAPGIEFVTRPFRRDLLVGGDVVGDFLAEILRLPALDVEPVWANRGLPLDLINLLALDQDSGLWDTPHDNRRLTTLKQALAEVEVPVPDELQASRALLQQVCHERFEADNRQLAARAGWGEVELVPPTDVETAGRGLAAFDELWRPAVDQSAVDWLHTSLLELVHRYEARVATDHELAAARRELTDSEQRRAASEAALARAEERHERLLERKVVRAGLWLARAARPLMRR